MHQGAPPQRPEHARCSAASHAEAWLAAYSEEQPAPLCAAYQKTAHKTHNTQAIGGFCGQTLTWRRLTPVPGATGTHSESLRLLPLIRLWHSGSDSCTTAVHHKGIYPFVRLCTTATLAVTGSVQVMKQRGPVLSGSPLGGDVMRQWSTGALSLEQGASFLGASNSGSHWQHCVK